MSSIRSFKSNKSGFAILPIVVVVGVLGLIGVAGFAVYQAGQDKAQVSQISDYNVDDDGDLWIGNNTPLSGTVHSLTESELLSSITGADLAAYNSVNVQRIGGDSRFRTAIEVSKYRYPNGGALAKKVIVVNGESYSDAVSAASLSSTLGMPLLYVPSTQDNGGYGLMIEIGQEIGRLDATEVFIVGGEAAVSQSTMNIVLDAARGASGTTPTTTRLAGDTRIQSSIEVAKRAGSTDTLFIANGYVESDSALFQSGYEKGGLVYINDPAQSTSLPDPVREYIQQINPSKIRLLGGTTVIPESINSEIANLLPNAEILRIAGQNRYHTATSLSQYLYPNQGDADTVYLVNNIAESDAILANSLSLGVKGPVLYINALDIPTQVAQEIHRLNPQNLVIIGGSARVSEDTAVHARAIASRALDLNNLDALGSNASGPINRR
jgi:putative cell wall-binding protein